MNLSSLSSSSWFDWFKSSMRTSFQLPPMAFRSGTHFAVLGYASATSFSKILQTTVWRKEHCRQYKQVLQRIWQIYSPQGRDNLIIKFNKYGIASLTASQILKQYFHLWSVKKIMYQHYIQGLILIFIVYNAISVCTSESSNRLYTFPYPTLFLGAHWLCIWVFSNASV